MESIEIHWASTSPDPAPIQNIWQLLKMSLRRTKIKSHQPLVSAMKRRWESFLSELTIKLIHSMNNRISEVFESYVDFVLSK